MQIRRADTFQAPGLAPTDRSDIIQLASSLIPFIRSKWRRWEGKERERGRGKQYRTLASRNVPWHPSNLRRRTTPFSLSLLVFFIILFFFSFSFTYYTYYTFNFSFTLNRLVTFIIPWIKNSFRSKGCLLQFFLFHVCQIFLLVKYFAFFSLFLIDSIFCPILDYASPNFIFF